MGEVPTTALEHISFALKKGEILIILGPSGSGKTTLLNVLSGLDTVDSGHVFFQGKDIARWNDRKLTRFRKQNVGFIFQTYNLLEHLNVYENILVGAQLGGNRNSIESIMETIGLTTHKGKYMHELSGGEQQRVSIARALAKQPLLMFCDEPTGALDEKTGKDVLESLVEANEKYHTTMVIVTHNPGIAYIGDRVVHVNSGKIASIEENKQRMNPKEIPWG